jgi:hypothetical protein
MDGAPTWRTEMRNFTDLAEPFRQAYLQGYNAKMGEINGMGWEEARDKFNAEYPVPYKPQSSEAYYYACGEIDALADQF